MARKQAACPDAFPVAKARMAALREAEAAASATLRAFPGVGTGAMGLTPDAVKAAPGYRAAWDGYHDAARAARAYAGPFVRTYKRELADERAARRASGIL